jgi:hypothetical protein
MNQKTYFNRNALSFNEGGGWFNFHIRWSRGFFFYFYLFGIRVYWGSK